MTKRELPKLYHRADLTGLPVAGLSMYGNVQYPFSGCQITAGSVVQSEPLNFALWCLHHYDNVRGDLGLCIFLDFMIMVSQRDVNCRFGMGHKSAIENGTSYAEFH